MKISLLLLARVYQSKLSEWEEQVLGKKCKKSGDNLAVMTVAGLERCCWLVNLLHDGRNIRGQAHEYMSRQE